MTTMNLPHFVVEFRRAFPDLAGTRVLVALSGGADSVALLVALVETAGQLGLSLRAAHVHHHLRGAAADADAHWCLQFCREVGVGGCVLHLDQPVPPRGMAPEAWWRQERYRLLTHQARQEGCTAVLTAHTLDDQAETVLLKLLTGSGPRGVAGIRRRCGLVARPLLGVRRAQLRAFLAERGVVWREDASNQEIRFPRAWVRHNLLPLLESRFPRASEHLTWLAEDLAEDEEVLGQWLMEGGEWPEVGGSVSAASLRQLPPPLLARWTLHLAARLPIAEPPSRVQLALVSGMVQEGRPAAVDLGRRWVLRRCKEKVLLLPPPCPPFAAQDARGEVRLPGGWRATLGVQAVPRGTYVAWLDAGVFGAGPVWRSVQRGEGWPEQGFASLARALAAVGIPATWRAAWPVLEAGGRIVWIPALGVAAEWAGKEEAGIAATLEEPWQRRWK